MIIRLSEIYLIGALFSIVIGYQLSAYFLFQYKKYKDKKLIYNKILLSYGITIFLTLSSYLLQIIIEMYLREFLVYHILQRISFIIFSIAVCYFLISLLSKPFVDIINRPLIRIIIVYIIIAMIIMIFLENNLIEFGFRAVAAILAGLYLLLFQIKLIRLTTGNIKKSLILFTIGLILALIGGTLSNKEVYTYIGSEVYYLSVFIILAGISIAFIGIYNFPAFLEFEWKESLQKLYIFEQEKFKILYTYDFQRLNNTSSQTTYRNLTEDIDGLFSRGISGIEQVTTHLAKSDGERIHKIKQGSSYILLEYGDPPISNITFALLVTKDMYSLRYILGKFKSEFQEKYRYLLNNMTFIEENKEKLFFNFNTNILSILT